MKNLLLILSVVLFTGCNGLERILEGAKSYPPEHVSYPDVYVVKGVTIHDYQMFYNIPTENRTIDVEVKITGAIEFRPLNKYEFKVYVPEPGITGNAVEFKREIILRRHLIIITGRPAAPAGTEFVITATKIP